jgi:cyclophilin family peptidyl-prolyl cis-trans isomerase
MMKRVLFYCSLFFIVAMAAAHAQSGETAPMPQPGPAAAEYQTVLVQWKALLVELRSLQEKYRTADAAERADLQQQWNKQTEKGNVMEKRLLEAASKAYAEAPNTDKQISDLLYAVLNEDMKTDNYQEALPLAELLVKNKFSKNVVVTAGMAAYYINDFDKAEQYLQEAKKDSLLDREADGVLKQLPQIKQKWADEQKLRQAEAKADDLPRVLIKTNKGDIEVELFENEAPNTVANFISLVEKKFYDGAPFHRVLEGFMAQGGDPTGTGRGGPGYTIKDEFKEPHSRLHFYAVLSMAHSDRPNSAGSQFYITFKPISWLDGGYTVFGRVIAGFDVLPKIQRRDPDKPNQPTPDKIIEAKVIRKRNHEYVPKTISE